ncbi:uncharacterized protein BDR25DRAFT_306349 [Lindgomyces ingoldianus]|uniref:Uncharacterized protein n=1 Tax=Lindgomyces ingoldianus TaxID=673940 RepID=A0ACB6QGT9_9PLEO|nr:uncharacterized protein BDR25DRAFT_306349 [Lindgomyces ingoldianus]KAF2466198.1 hypothetical protein BDR25DRAFT_306349 [Lindgomyces ingoldianus]
MAQFPGAPPPGAYVPPQGSAPYGQQPHKSTAGLGGILNQAVTTGKPFLNKLGKTISSKVGNKQSTPATPQHLAGYQQYQAHQQQSYGQDQQQQQNYGQNQQQQQNYGQSQQQQQQQPWQQQQNTYQAPGQSPLPPSNYTSPASNQSGQSNYFPQQTSQTPNPPQQQQQNAPGYNPNQLIQGQGVEGQQGQSASGQPQAAQFQQGQFQDQGSQGQFQQEQHQQGQFQQGQGPQGQFQQNQPQDQSQQGQFEQIHSQQASFPGQQTGVIGAAQPAAQNLGPASPQPSNVSQHFQNQPSPQQQWAPPTPSSGIVTPTAPQQVYPNPSPTPQNSQPYAQTPPPQQYGTAPQPPVHPNQQQQQWVAMSPVSPQGQAPNQIPPSISPPPPQSAGNQAQAPPNIPQQPPQQPQPTPPPQSAPPPSAPTAFIAELPADLGNLTLENSAQPQRPPSNTPQSSPYQAYQPAQGDQKPGFTVPRRALSTSSLPLADPWRVADPATEQPTREFYIIADLLFDGLDRKCEPQNTGMLEASKILESWKVQTMADEAAHIFEYKTYNAFAKLWILEGVPHMMVPCQPSLTPVWNLQQSSSQDMKLLDEPPAATSGYPVYMPAINRAGWYKYLFMEMICEPEGLDKMMPAFCGDTYKPGVFNHPDIKKQDRTELPELTTKINAVRQGAVSRVVQETAAEMQAAQGGGATGSGGGGMTEQEAALKMHSLKMQQQTNAMLNQTMMNAGKSFSMGAGNVYVPRF